MPVYEYFCRTCNQRYERLRPMKDADAPIACPSCKTDNSVRALSVVIMHSGSRTAGVAENVALRDHAHTDSMSIGGGCCGGACGCTHH